MPELFIELFSEEIPARLQARGAAELTRLVADSLSAIAPSAVRTMFGPRRIALAAEVAPGVAASMSSERGPRTTAPEQAVAGFLRKHAATRDALRQEGDFWVLDRASVAVDAATLIAGAMPGLLRRFAWPKSMRWGGTSAFTWIRPLRRIVCLLDGGIVPFDLAAEGDDGHGLASGDATQGHRVHAPQPVQVTGFAQWQAILQSHRVVADAQERARLIRDGLAALAAARGLSIVEDAGLVDEVAGLVEWPVPLLGRIDDAFMDLPPEVMQVSMRVNQRYFALRDADGRAAPWFAFAANIDAPDAGAAIVAGNERVLRARFSDARHFWDLDRRTKLADRVAALDGVTFHAQLGSQGDRVRRLEVLANSIATMIGTDNYLTKRAARLCKADLTTGMVGEFPELQGTMGYHYAKCDNENPVVQHAIRDHYLPRGIDDKLPTGRVSCAVALADKLDQIVAFFSIGQRPTGSGDPYALRRAALGVVRITREESLPLLLKPIIEEAHRLLKSDIPIEQVSAEVIEFFAERMKVLLRSENFRLDVMQAILTNDMAGNLLDFLNLVNIIQGFLTTSDGIDLLAAYQRAGNILNIENRKDGPHDGEVEKKFLIKKEELELYEAILETQQVEMLIANGRSFEAIAMLAHLREPLDKFFNTVMVNDKQPSLRKNRLCLLNFMKNAMDRVADFSLIKPQQADSEMPTPQQDSGQRPWPSSPSQE